MLELMRKGLKGWFGKALIILFVAPFLFFGAESFFTVFTNSNSAIEVNGVQITEQQIVNAVENNKEQIRRRFGSDFDMSVFSDAALREGASGQLIESELLRQYADKNNISISFKKLSEIIRGFPVFAGPDGQFSQEVFETIAARQGVSTKYLINLIKSDVSVAQVEEAVTNSGFGLVSEVELIEKLNNQERDISYIYLSLDEFRKQVNVTDQEISEFYEANKPSFMTEESVRVEYLELKLEDFAQKVSVDEQEVKSRFENEQQQLNENAQRKASHILVAIDDSTNQETAYTKIKEIADKISAGEDFSELAKQFSQDPGSSSSGGDLGFASKGAYVPEFEAALYSLKKGEVSEPVLTEFGYHIIKLTDIAEVNSLDFEKEKSRIVNEIKTEQSYDLYQQAISKLEEMIYENPNLDEAALTLASEIKVTKAFTRSEGEGIAARQDIRDVAFSKAILNEAENSSVIEIEQGHAIALRLNEFFPSELKPIEQVSEQIRVKLETEKAEALISEQLADVIVKLEIGETLESIQQSVGKEWQTKKNIKRRDSSVDSAIVKKAFELERPQEGAYSFSKVEVGEHDVAVVNLLNVHEVTEPVEPNRLKGLIKQANFQVPNDEWKAYLEYMKSNANITYKKAQSDDDA